MYGSFDVSVSGLVAQRTRLNVIAGNLANAASLVNDAGEYDPYRRRAVLLAPDDDPDRPAAGVRVIDIAIDDSDLVPKHEPDSPFANAEGYVHYPNVDSTVEQMNAMEAMRAYEANIVAIETSKAMVASAMDLLA